MSPEPFFSEDSPPADRIVGVVLAGGKSTRLGRDKVVEVVGGKSLLAATVELVAGVTGEVVVSGRDPAPLGVAVPWLPDAVSGTGPAGGILTALTALGRPVLAVSCDLPFLRRDTLTALLAARQGRPAAALMTTYRRTDTGYVESLVAVYEPAGAPILKRAVAEGLYRLSAVFPEAIRHHLDYDPADPEAAKPFFNINYPRDLDLAREMEQAS
ncbi:molybdopterin-guanine dinucleotide biosynthesis protein moba [hydrocarbon metagenome]|uniref:Molybdopterin-guanine dinucleotide biosynthesis protein moba n=1 Tax=hydrocarbon metagenome TaxID=938273 RepID=A0A0W8G3F1_9ZZZZ